MKEVNEPNEFVLEPFNLTTIPAFWIYKSSNVRLKSLDFRMERLRKQKARFDVFINGLFITPRDYFVEYRDNDIYIKFLRERFPPFDRFGNVFELTSDDVVTIDGDLERVN